MSSSSGPSLVAGNAGTRSPLPEPAPPAATGPQRRRLFGLVVAAATLSGCGFRLRGDVSYAFATATVNTPTSPSFGIELRRLLEANGSTRLVDIPAQAEVIIDVLAVVDDKGVLSLSSGGRVREYLLTKRVNFSVHDKAGNDWLPASEITIRRNFTFNESEVLAREAQEQQLFREMQTDAVRQMLRRLQAAKRPA